MHPDKSAAVIGLLDLRPGITPEDFADLARDREVQKLTHLLTQFHSSELLSTVTAGIYRHP